MYDSVGRPTDTYGPAPSSCFTGQLPNGSCTNPPPAHTATQYDGGIVGLAAAYWDNKTLTGTPKLHATGVDPTGVLSKNWVAGSPDTLIPTDNWSARFTGDITFPASGTYALRIDADNGIRVFVDDVAVIDSWVDGPPTSRTGSYANTTAGSKHRIQVDYYDATGNAFINFYWTPPAGTEALVPGANLSPRYGLATRVTIDDTTGGVNQRRVDTAYATPHLGMATSSTVDPTGLALTTGTAYEVSGSGYLRPVTTTLPAGNTWTTTYYGATQVVTNPCAAGSANQGGLAWKRTGPDPDGAGSGDRTSHRICL